MTENIIIIVKSKYLPERSNQNKSVFLFSYNVKITNKTRSRVQLLSRYWNITDGNKGIEDVHGPGVIGQKPTINAGESHSYISFCRMSTPIGFMKGSFRFIKKEASEFDVPIKTFKLIAKQELN